MSELVQYDADDIAWLRERLGDKTWDDFCSMWEEYRDADPSMGGCDVPHLFAVRFMHKYRSGELAEPFAFYLALREAFFQCGTLVTETYAPGKRWFK